MKISRNLIIGGVVAIVVIIGVVLYFIFGTTAPIKLYSVEAKTGNITEKINLTGQVKASQGVDLAFESPGKIVVNYVKVGDKIYAGQTLVAIDSSTLQSQLNQAQAQLQQAQAQVDVLDIGTVESKTNVSLQSLYSGSLTSAQKSINTAKNILLTISDIQFIHFTSQTPGNSALQQAKAKAVFSLLGQQDAALWTSQNIGQLNGGAYGLVQVAVNNPTQENIDAALSATQTALQDINSLINAVPIDPSLSPTERATLNSVETGINTEIITTSANVQAIASLKVNNSATISTTNDQIEAAKAVVAGVEANINSIKTQIAKTVIVALFNGQVDKDNAIVGQLVSPSSPVITISNDNLEIDTNIPEIDLSAAKVGANANITLDAFGNNVISPSTIVSIDSAPTIVNGIPAYSARLKFKDSDNRVKTGMTANITVISDTHSNVLIVPISAVIQNNNKYFVIVDKGNSQKETREVNVGLKDDNNIEIISGLKLGEKIFAY
jgi:HlyD family secretion protein